MIALPHQGHSMSRTFGSWLRRCPIATASTPHRVRNRASDATVQTPGSCGTWLWSRPTTGERAEVPPPDPPNASASWLRPERGRSWPKAPLRCNSRPSGTSTGRLPTGGGRHTAGRGGASRDKTRDSVSATCRCRSSTESGRRSTSRSSAQ